MRIHSTMVFNIRIALTGAIILVILGGCSKGLPKEWTDEWTVPGPINRPLQIVHGADIRNKAEYFRDSCGLGGVVCNFPFGDHYLKSQSDWDVYTEGVKMMTENGLRVWIYDEDGYPSLAAGGRVLEADSTLEALEMVYDENSDDPFTVRTCYEFTHACNNYYIARRYPDPLNPLSTKKFIELTHQAYYNHLGPDLYGKVEAFFTDEPSMMAVNLGQLSEDVRKNVRIKDPLDPARKNLPMISWTQDIPQKYKESYGEEIAPTIRSVFSGTDEKDKVIRQKFWSLLARLDKQYYYDAIREWSSMMREQNGGKGPVSSGHGLREENPVCHVPLDGNKLLVSSGFDIPGLDQLNSDPDIWRGSAWMAAFFPNSAAYLNEQRRVMCEMSDFTQTMAGKGPVTLEKMQAATGWQTAFGVTDFTLYFTITYGDQYPYRTEEQYKNYCDFVGRINAVVMKAEPVRKVLLYYPIYDLQREFTPVAEKADKSNQNPLMQKLVASFSALGGNLLKAQIQFVLVDYLTLEKAKISGDNLQIGQHQYNSMVFPGGVTLPPKITDLIRQAKSKGVKIIYTDTLSVIPSPEELSEMLDISEKLAPAGPCVAFGKFLRNSRTIYQLTNTDSVSYNGKLRFPEGRYYIVMNPQNGLISDPVKIKDDEIPVSLDPMQTLLLVTQ